MSTVPTLVTPERLVLLRVKLVAEANGAEAIKSAKQVAARTNFPRETARIKISPFFVVTICRSISTTRANCLREASTLSSRRVNYLEIGKEVRRFELPTRVQRLAQN